MRKEEPKNPSEGLMMNLNKGKTAASSVVTKSRGVDKDWMWMVIGFLLLRGTWTRAIAAPLEALGLESVSDMLGLI